MADKKRKDPGNALLAIVVGGILVGTVALSFFGGLPGNPGNLRGVALSFDPPSVPPRIVTR